MVQYKEALMKNWSGRAVVATCIIGAALICGAIYVVWKYGKLARLSGDSILTLVVSSAVIGAVLLAYEIYDWRKNKRRE